MRVMGIDDSNSVVVEEGAKLPKFIRTLKIETAEEEQQLRLFLTGVLKVDKDGCHSMGRDFGSNALSQNPDVSNGSRALGNKESKGAGLKFNYPLEDTLQIIDTLAAVLNINGCSDVKDTASEKLNLLIQSI